LRPNPLSSAGLTRSRRNQSGRRRLQSSKFISAWRFWRQAAGAIDFMSFDLAIAEVLGGRVLPFDRKAAETSAALAAQQRQRGRPVETRDVQSAGIAVARKAFLATRNTRHFEDLGINLIDPWHV
jgi:predicted nucleic acid-binding protein